MQSKFSHRERHMTDSTMQYIDKNALRATLPALNSSILLAIF